MKPIVHTAQNSYTSFGSVMQGRAYSSAAYRFGFNGQEKDGELGDAYAFEYRIHDSRLGRFLSVDPVAFEYPWNSSFSFAENDVVRCIDLEGREKYVIVRCWDNNKYKGTVCIYLPNKNYTRLYRNGANTNKTMILNLNLTDQQISTLRGDIFQRSQSDGSTNSEIIGLKPEVNDILFNTTTPGTRGKKAGAVLVDESPNENEKAGLKTSEEKVESGAKFAARLITAELRTFHYEFDQSVTISLNADEIQAYKDFLDKNPDYVITVTGNTDKKGTDKYNEKLGLKRANDVKKYLVTNGIDASRIKTVSNGESQATVEESASDDERKPDRNVTIQWTPKKPD